MNESTRVASLTDALPRLSGGDQAFAVDLITSFSRRRSLSDKQWLWVDKLTQRATNPAADQPATEAVGDFNGVMALFQRAKQKLRYPKIVLQIDHQPVHLSLAGPRSKHEGQVQVTDGGSYGNNVWFGRVDAAGNWTQSRSITEEDVRAVRRLLQEFSKDPAGVAKKHGALTGRCCFCNTKLTDEHSTAVGFGPTCAKNYGLEAEWKGASALLAAA
jgi:hypothetical protein